MCANVAYVDIHSLCSSTEPGSFVRLDIFSLNQLGPDGYDTLIESDKKNISFMVRSPVTNIMDIITDNLLTGKSSKRIIIGPPGCGKSSSIYQIVQYCKLKGWIVVYLPKCEALMFDTGTLLAKTNCENILRQLIQLNKAIFDIAS